MAWPYGYRWQQQSRAFLRQHPLCMCPHCREGKVRIKPSSVVDHIVPHKGNMKLFWDKHNWQALNKECHDSWKQRLEKSGEGGFDVDGNPIAKLDHWR